MDFIALETKEQVENISKASGLQAIFKHNTTCSISIAVREQFEKEADRIPGLNQVYFLDLLQHRDVSGEIATTFELKHESPQLLLIRDGKCIYSDSLYDITAERAASAAV